MHQSPQRSGVLRGFSRNAMFGAYRPTFACWRSGRCEQSCSVIGWRGYRSRAVGNVVPCYPRAVAWIMTKGGNRWVSALIVGPAGLEPATRCSFGVFSLTNDFDVKMNRNPPTLSNCSRSSRYAYIENKDDATEIRSPARIVRTRSSLTNAVLLSIKPEPITLVKRIGQSRQLVAKSV